MVEEEKHQQHPNRDGRMPLRKEMQEEESGNTDRDTNKKEEGKTMEESKLTPGFYRICGKVGHKSEDCFKPVICARCKKEGHVPRACNEIMPWECIASFCGLASPELGFHIIHDDDPGDTSKDTSNYALITIKQGVATARQVEAKFKAQSEPNSTWRCFAKKVAENKYQMKFPTAKKVEELAFFSGILMGTVLGVTFKVEPWDPYVGAKAKIESTWFRIYGNPMEKRTEKRACYVASLVGVPLEVDKNNLKKVGICQGKDWLQGYI
jgi:hypothetical protein